MLLPVSMIQFHWACTFLNSLECGKKKKVWTKSCHSTLVKIAWLSSQRRSALLMFLCMYVLCQSEGIKLTLTFRELTSKVESCVPLNCLKTTLTAVWWFLFPEVSSHYIYLLMTLFSPTMDAVSNFRLLIMAWEVLGFVLHCKVVGVFLSLRRTFQFLDSNLEKLY